MVTNQSVRPFRIQIPESDLADLQRRLAATRLPVPLPGDGWDTGVPVAYLRELVRYWKDDYDWRGQETELNRFPQFLTEIDGQRVHFLNVRSPDAGATPLLLTHGWPGSFVEFLDLIGPLTRPEDHGADGAPAFHVVIPSLPGFAFSSPVNDAGWGPERVAAAWAELMNRLGYERYGTQGGDLGAGIATAVGRCSPSKVIGVHTNGSLGTPLHNPAGEELASLTPLEQDRVRRVQLFMDEEFGYIAIQGTRPQLIGAALSDSPLAQLAWIVDKFQAWTHPREALPDDVISRDRLLTNVMLYWLTGTGGSSAFIGYAQTNAWGEPKQSSGVPTASIQFAHDVGIRRYAEIEDRITRWTDIEGRGGHFAALEEPGLLVQDIREFFAELRQGEPQQPPARQPRVDSP